MVFVDLVQEVYQIVAVVVLLVNFEGDDGAFVQVGDYLQVLLAGSDPAKIII